MCCRPCAVAAPEAVLDWQDDQQLLIYATSHLVAALQDDSLSGWAGAGVEHLSEEVVL